jgi:hypothetical protein
MFREITPWHRHATPLSRAVHAMPAVPHPHVPHRKRSRFGTGAVVRAVAGLVAVLIGTGGVILREKLTSMFRRKKHADGGESPADAAEE